MCLQPVSVTPFNRSSFPLSRPEIATLLAYSIVHQTSFSAIAYVPLNSLDSVNPEHTLSQTHRTEQQGACLTYSTHPTHCSHSFITLHCHSGHFIQYHSTFVRERIKPKQTSTQSTIRTALSSIPLNMRTDSSISRTEPEIHHTAWWEHSWWLLYCVVVDVIFPHFPLFFPLTWIGRVRLIPDNTKIF
jgi:hypothetical protein